MFGPPGVAYVYLVYGMYACLNVVTEPDGQPAAVLIRAVAPLSGETAMRRARLAHELDRRRITRGTGDPSAGVPARQRAQARIAAIPTARLASGPGLVAAAFSVDRALTGTDLCDPASALRLETAPDEARPFRIATSPRVGIAYAGEPWTSRAWRYYVHGDPAVSAGPPGTVAPDTVAPGTLEPATREPGPREPGTRAPGTVAPPD
jgi:DNA-3-methyladenine glycosylase